MEPLLTVIEACRILRISRPTLYRLINTGRLRAHFVAKQWLLRQKDIEAYLESVAVSPARK